MRFPIRFIPEKTKFRFIRYRIPALVMSGVVLLATIGLVAAHGLNLGIDFTGGALIEMRTEQPADLAQLRPLLNAQGFGEVSLQNFGDSHDVLIRIQAGEENHVTVVEKAKTVLIQALGTPVFRRVEFVGPTVGRELMRGGVLALGLSLIAMAMYIWFRFEWQYGVGGILALLHDAIAVVGFYAITGLDFGLPAIAAILTIIGYSINDSVVIYDRIRENMRKYKKMPLDELIDLSVNETLSRTILTGGTVLLSTMALVLFGGEVIRSFSLAMAFGVVVGTYSSIYISATVLIYLNLRPQAPAEVVNAKA